MKYKKQTLAISPSVGVILLIGITVATGTIAGIVLYEIDSPNTVSASGVTVNENPDGVEVTWTESGTAEKIKIMVNGKEMVELNEVNDGVVLGTPEDST